MSRTAPTCRLSKPAPLSKEAKESSVEATGRDLTSVTVVRQAHQPVTEPVAVTVVRQTHQPVADLVVTEPVEVTGRDLTSVAVVRQSHQQVTELVVTELVEVPMRLSG